MILFVKFDTFWAKYRDKDKDGLMEYGNQDALKSEQNVSDATVIKWETGWDSSPRWDTGCKNKEPIDLNCFLLMQKRCLGLMAKELGKTAESRHWQEEAASLADKINRHMYCKEDGAYYDIFYDTHTFSKVKTPAMFFFRCGFVSPAGSRQKFW